MHGKIQDQNTGLNICVFPFSINFRPEKTNLICLRSSAPLETFYREFHITLLINYELQNVLDYIYCI